MTVNLKDNEKMAAYLERKYRATATLNLEDGKDVVVRVEDVDIAEHKRGNRTVISYRLKLDEVDGKPVKVYFECLSKDFNVLVKPYAVGAKGKSFTLGYTKGATHKQRVWKFESEQ
jgi:hypothetical protein